MTALAELGLTPSQYAEVERLDPHLVNAWLNALEAAGRTVKSPVAWFLAAIRTGAMPGTAPTPAQTQEVKNAETWIRNVGACFTTTEESLVASALFGDFGLIRHCDHPTRQRLLEMWRQLAPSTDAPPDPSLAGEPEPFRRADHERDWSEQ